MLRTPVTIVWEGVGVVRSMAPLADDRRWVSVFLAILPWGLVVIGTVLFFVGFYYGEITEADTANGVLLAVGVVFLLAGFAVSCVRNITPAAPEDDAPRQTNATQLLPAVPVSL